MKRIITIIIICGLANLTFSQNFGIDQPNPTQKLDVNGNIKIGDNISVEGSSSYRVYRNLCSYSAGSGSPGAFAITTNQPWNSACMFRVKIEGYFYDATSPFDLTVGGYIYVNNDFYNYGYINNGSKNLNVRLARNNSTNTVAILLGDEGSGYPYPKLSVVSFMQGHSSTNEAYGDGWTITQVTSLSGFSYIYTVPDVTSSGSSAGLTLQTKYNIWTTTTTSTSNQVYIDAAGSDLSITAQKTGSIFKITVYAQGYQARAMDAT